MSWHGNNQVPILMFNVVVEFKQEMQQHNGEFMQEYTWVV